VAPAAAQETSTPAAAAQETPTYTNGRVVSFDSVQRTMVVETASGDRQRLELDDNTAGLGDIKSGDHVIVGINGAPGQLRVSSISKVRASLPLRAASPPARPTLLRDDSKDAAAARRVFSDRVAAVAPQAGRVDGLWSTFKDTCEASSSARYDGAREWFGLWDDQVSADLSSGFCRDLFNQIVGLGETVKTQMAGAEDVARRSLAPGSIREIRRRYALDWEGWDLAPPERLAQ
jgi:hypothetical protein